MSRKRLSAIIGAFFNFVSITFFTGRDGAFILYFFLSHESWTSPRCKLHTEIRSLFSEAGPRLLTPHYIEWKTHTTVKARIKIASILLHPLICIAVAVYKISIRHAFCVCTYSLDFSVPEKRRCKLKYFFSLQCTDTVFFFLL